jgi:hypothetical protein
VKVTKLLIPVALIALVFATRPLGSFAKPEFLPKATKFGAKNCLFCHVKPKGGEPWNKRGQWLISEKTRRKAHAINVEWLANYKEN